MSQRETDHTDEGKSGSEKDDFVDNHVLEAQSDAHSSSSSPDLTVPCSGALSEDMQAVKKHQVNRKINEGEQSISELDKEVNEENENKQKRISDLEEKLNKVNEENEKKQKRISDLEEKLNKVNEENENKQKRNSDLEEKLNKVNEENEKKQKRNSDLEEKLNKVNEENEKNQKRISDLEEKLKEAEGNTRKFDLWLYGLKEEEPDNLKKRVFDICCSVAPEVAPDFDKHIDIVVRVGQKTEGKTRPVILSFTERSTKELLLASYSSEYHRSFPLKFKDFLTAKEIDTRNRLWPRIEAARKKKNNCIFHWCQSYNRRQRNQ